MCEHINIDEVSYDCIDCGMTVGDRKRERIDLISRVKLLEEEIIKIKEKLK